MSRETTLKEAKQALSRGDYRLCIYLLDLLLESDSLQSDEGGEIGTIMITALIGQGNTQKAICICEILAKHKRDLIRQQAKQYISVLNSPSLERPDNWSIKIPDLTINNHESFSGFKRKLKKEKKFVPLPPTGSTKYLSLGFTVISCLIFSLLTFLLSCCVEFNTEIEINGPDRIRMNWNTQSNSNQLIPWQENFNSSLRNISAKFSIATIEDEGKQIIKAPSFSSKDANTTLQNIASIAAENAGFELPKIELNLQEKNWLIGFKQQLKIAIDLTNLPKIPNLKLDVLISSPSNIKRPPNSSPNKTKAKNNQFNWKLQEGVVNNLSLQKWHWSSLGIGSIAVLTLMILIMILQRIKLLMGFGFPELPP